jgi:hypothetical protein
MYRSQQTFPSTTIRDDRSIAAPEMTDMLSIQCSVVN